MLKRYPRYYIETAIYFPRNTVLLALAIEFKQPGGPTVRLYCCTDIHGSQRTRNAFPAAPEHRERGTAVVASSPMDGAAVRRSAGHVAAVEVDDVAQRVPGPPAAQVIREDAHHVGLESHVVTGHVRRDEDVGQSPQG